MTGVGLITKNGPAVYETKGMSGVIVPFDGVEAKLSIVKKPLATHSNNAANARGETAPSDSEMDFLMMPYESEKTAKRFYLTP